MAGERDTDSRSGDAEAGPLFAAAAADQAAQTVPLERVLASYPWRALPGAVPAWRITVTRDALSKFTATLAGRGARLAALWGSDERDRAGGSTLHLALAVREGLVWVECPLPADDTVYPDLSALFAPAARMQRAAFDLLGIRADATDQRRWLRHGAWPADAFPLRRDRPADHIWPPIDDEYTFVQVAGDGVHEIPVGPVHAGTIEPGHFRFSIVGEKVLRLEQRLGYKHKGIDKRFVGATLEDAARLAARVSGDSTCAFSWAYAMAIESACGFEAPIRATALRALALERERIANHLGDLGYLGNDGGLTFGLMQFMRLKEDVLRLNQRAFGHRYAMDLIVPGGVARDLHRDSLAAILAQCDELQLEVTRLRAIYEDHAGLQDRFQTCGRLEPALAARLGVIGLAGRASGQRHDARVTPGFAPYPQLVPNIVVLDAGDVAARVLVRFEEIVESLRLIRALLDALPPGAHGSTLAVPQERKYGLGWVEGWRGESIVALECEGGHIRHAHAHDPSWQNWPALEHAILGNIVPDFPLINKSFNLSYSGADL
jgi:Ni,Fe-hydrogenase III large subunit/Ni,Fe-hydrogenase III component G